MSANWTFSWLREVAPEFVMSGDDIEVITSPKEFFTVLNSNIKNATKRIAVASLYLGTGVLEQQLVSSMHQALNASTDGLRINVLLDFTRGSRGGNTNSRTMLLPLLAHNGDAPRRRHTIHVALYHTPDLRGILKCILPDRWNEILGLAHMKIYVVDDTVVISGWKYVHKVVMIGPDVIIISNDIRMELPLRFDASSWMYIKVCANLSNDYFTNRQDRYVLFHDAMLADFFDELISTVSSFSLQLQPDNSVSLSSDWDIHPYNGCRQKFKHEARKRIQNLMESWKNRLGGTNGLLNSHKNGNTPDSKIYPLIQMGHLGVTHDSDATERIFRMAPDFSRIVLASGYFNLTGRYIDMVLNSSAADYSILTAAPKANGFFIGKGLTASIPKVYTYVASLFYDKIVSLNQQSRVSLFEYELPQWTFHAKGLWYYHPNSVLPAMTLIGSPNFGYRSVHRDLEAQVAIVTENTRLQQQLYSEQTMLFSASSPVTGATFTSRDRYVPLWVRCCARMFKSFF